MNTAQPSTTILLQKLQHLYSSHKKQNDTSISPQPIKPFATREINQLLEKSQQAPYLNVNQYDIDQWTERIIKQSCSSFTQNENALKSDIHLQKYSQISSISNSIAPTLTQIEKKVKLLKYAKENDHNTCAAIIAKMKLFCLDNAQICFDFYRSTDLILLKYMIFLLIQELNTQPVSKPEPVLDQTTQFQNMVKDIVSIVYEIIEEMKQKQHHASTIDSLNKQITKIQNKFDPTTVQKSSKHHHRFSSCNFENCKTPPNKLATEFNLSSDKFKLKKKDGSQKIIQYQIDELEQKKQTINKLNEQIQKLQNNNKQQLIEIADLNAQVTSLKLQVKTKQDEIEQLQTNNELLKSNNKIYLEEKEQYFNLYQDYELENIQLKQQLETLKDNNQMISSEYDKYKQETHEYYQEQCNQIQNSKENEIAQLRNELIEKQQIINQLLGDALYFGKQYKNVVDSLVNLPTENLIKDLPQIQKELFISENTLNAKLNAIADFSDNLLYNAGSEYLTQSQLSQGKQSSKKCQELVLAQKSQFEIMNMLLVQSQVLEKFLI